MLWFGWSGGLDSYFSLGVPFRLGGVGEECRGVEGRRWSIRLSVGWLDVDRRHGFCAGRRVWVREGRHVSKGYGNPCGT